MWTSHSWNPNIIFLHKWFRMSGMWNFLPGWPATFYCIDLKKLIYSKWCAKKSLTNLDEAQKRDRDREREGGRKTSTAVHILLIPKLKRIVEPHHNTSVTALHILLIPKFKSYIFENQLLVISNLSSLNQEKGREFCCWDCKYGRTTT